MLQRIIRIRRYGVYSSLIPTHVPKALLPEFAKALTLADHVVLADIYAARETDNLGISSQDLQKQIQELGTPCEYFPNFLMRSRASS